MGTEYYRLRAKTYRNIIVKGEDDGKCYRYMGDRGWVRSGIMIEFFCDESDYYDLYDEITDEEALKYIEDYWT